MPPAIATHHLTRRFGARVAVDDLELRVPKHGIYGFLRLNGGGEDDDDPDVAWAHPGGWRGGGDLWGAVPARGVGKDRGAGGDAVAVLAPDGAGEPGGDAAADRDTKDSDRA